MHGAILSGSWGTVLNQIWEENRQIIWVSDLDWLVASFRNYSAPKTKFRPNFAPLILFKNWERTSKMYESKRMSIIGASGGSFRFPIASFRNQIE